jgi:ectoine hydroxylase-related dioxygenase (phytanoyl-CoA dioxygenase family)
MFNALKLFAKQSPDAARFADDGYIIFENAIAGDFLERARADLRQTIAEHHDNIECVRYSQKGKMSDFNLADIFAEFNIVRITNVEQYSALFRELALSDVVRRFLGEVYGAPPTLLQTLTYAYSSHQGEHSDLHLVSPPWAGPYRRDTLAAAWFALEDAGPENGALVIYPGSHKIAKRKLDEFASYGDYTAYLRELMQSHGIAPKVFQAKAGDVLFWHGDFVHAGGIASNRERSRFSYVCHYANIGSASQALKKYLLPDHGRKLYKAQGGAKIYL